MQFKKILFVPALLLTCILSLNFTYSSSLPDEVENFTLKDYNGKTHSLHEYKDSKLIVLLFVSTECPISNDYDERMAELHKKYKDKGITFLGINSNKQESVSEIKEHAKRKGLSFPILKDEKNIIADKLEASVTPEAYVLNNNFKVMYWGRIDDSRNSSRINSKDLEKALDELLQGKPVTVKRTKAFGCTIKRV